MNIKYIALAVVAIAITSVGTITIATNSAFAIENNQVTFQDCGSESEPSDTECQNTASQIQGNEHAVSLASQQTFEEERKEHTSAPASQQSITPSIVLPH